LDLGLLAARLVRKLNDDGVGVTVRSAIAYLTRRKAADAFDLEYGTETDGLEPLWKLRIRSDNARCGERYQATTEHELVAALQSLGQVLGPFSFVDLGCGKGRTLLVASRLTFRRIVGVEFAEELVAIARRNLRTVDARNALVVHADAADFEFPPGDLVVYLYN
jgi:SAM-dependent methyltransferase